MNDVKTKLELAIAVMKEVNSFLVISTEGFTSLAIYRTPAQEMRLAADAMEAKDKAIYNFRNVLSKLTE